MTEAQSGATLAINPPTHTTSQTCCQCDARFVGVFPGDNTPSYRWTVPVCILVTDDRISGVYRTLKQAQEATTYTMTWGKGRVESGDMCWIARREGTAGYVVEYHIYEDYLIDPCDESGMSITDSK